MVLCIDQQFITVAFGYCSWQCNFAKCKWTHFFNASLIILMWWCLYLFIYIQ